MNEIVALVMTDETVAELGEAVEACDDARQALIEALAAADTHDRDPDDESILRPVGEALMEWRDAQERFMEGVEASEAPNVAMAAMILKTNHGIDATNARRGLPGVHVEGTDQPFDLDTSGIRGTILTDAAMHYVE